MTWPLSAFADEAGKTCDEQIAALKRDGLTHIDIRAMEGHNISVLPLDVAEAVMVKLQDAGITVNMFGSPLGKIDLADDMSIDLDKLRHMGKLKDIFNCNAVRIFSYYNRKAGVDAAAWQTQSLDRLKQLRDLAGELGMELYHENESDIFGDRLPHNEILRDELRDGKAFKLIFDFDNYRRDGDDVWANWLALADATDAFHLKDSDANDQHVPAGQGGGQIPRILADAAKRGWTGPVILEPHLVHSAAVVATGVSGSANESYKDMPQAEIFHVAAEAGIKAIEDAGATWS